MINKLFNKRTAAAAVLATALATNPSFASDTPASLHTDNTPTATKAKPHEQALTIHIFSIAPPNPKAAEELHLINHNRLIHDGKDAVYRPVPHRSNLDCKTSRLYFSTPEDIPMRSRISTHICDNFNGAKVLLGRRLKGEFEVYSARETTHEDMIAFGIRHQINIDREPNLSKKMFLLGNWERIQKTYDLVQQQKQMGHLRTADLTLK